MEMNDEEKEGGFSLESEIEGEEVRRRRCRKRVDFRSNRKWRKRRGGGEGGEWDCCSNPKWRRR